jgi:hypothetical protein
MKGLKPQESFHFLTVGSGSMDRPLAGTKWRRENGIKVFQGEKMNSNFKLFWEKLLNFWATRRRIIGGGRKDKR